MNGMHHDINTLRRSMHATNYSFSFLVALGSSIRVIDAHGFASSVATIITFTACLVSDIDNHSFLSHLVKHNPL